MTPRAALIPVADVARLRGLGDALDARAALVSAGEDRPTHLFVVAAALPPELAGSVARTPGAHLLFGEPDAWAFAEAGAAPEAGDRCTIRLAGTAETLSLSPADLRDVRALLDVAWTEPLRDAARRDPAPRDVALVPSDDARPVSAVIAPAAELEAHVFARPEWPDVRFATDGREAVLVGPRLDGLPGEAFHAVERRLHLPLGRRLDPPFAAAVALRRLGAGALWFWRAAGLLRVAESALAPLHAREWHARRP